MELFYNILRKCGHLFYIVNPKETSFESHETVPDYNTDIIPLFIGFIVIEQLIGLYKGMRIVRVNDAITSMTQGMLSELIKFAFHGGTLVTYLYVYNNWRFATLPWDSVWTWISALLIVDFVYYWFHRASHEINLLWAAHQVHHSSEYYNLTTALRQSMFQGYFHSIFSLPMAFLVPPSVFLVHVQFNILYQFWIHTQLVKNLGPLELILNTPSHHRVHHGRNRYCIDKNYAGVFIIWDRMFGTFEAEGEPIAYGLTHNVNNFDPFKIQTHHFIHVFDKIRNSKGIYDKLWSVFKGPGWGPGKPRLGLIEEIPDVKGPQEVYHQNISLWRQIYAIVHFILLLVFHVSLAENHKTIPLFKVYILLLFMFASLTSFGSIMDKRKYSDIFELIRCAIYIVIENVIISALSTEVNFVSQYLRIAFYISFGIFSAVNILNGIKIRVHINKKSD